MGELDIQILLNKNLKGSSKKTHFSKEEKDFIRENHKTMTAHAIAKHLNRSASSILRYGHKAGISFSKYDRHIHKPSDEDIINYIEAHPDKPTYLIVSELHTSRRRVIGIREKFGLTINRNGCIKASLVYDWLLGNADLYKDKESLAEAFKSAFE